MHLILLALFALLAAATTTASPGKLTNSQRLARGLAPLPPKFGRNLPGVAVREPGTRPYAAKRSSPSGKPNNGWKIEVREGSDVKGYVENSASGCSAVSTESPLKVAISGYGPYDLKAISPIFPAPYYVGIEPGTSIGPGLKTPLSHVSQGSGSSIWFVDANSNQLTPHYIGPDGALAEILIVFSNGELFFAAEAEDGAVAVALFLVSA